MRLNNIREGELTLKVSANSTEEIEVFLDDLETIYKIYPSSVMKQNDKNKGFHLFLEVAPMESGG